MRVVAKAADVGDFAESLACVQQRPALQKALGVIQTKRVYEFAAGRAAPGKELLDIAVGAPTSYGRVIILSPR
jgi:hypothetical protein